MSSYNITDFPSFHGDGSANDCQAFADFNAQAVLDVGLVTLTIPSGAVCKFGASATNGSSSSGRWTKGIKQLLVNGYGATLRNVSSGFFLGGLGQGGVGTSARVATVSAGANLVTLLTPSQYSRFTVGNWALLTGFDLQGVWQGDGYGSPSNAHYFEYVKVTDINSSTGVVTFETPLRNTYRSTWPLYDAGGVLGPDQGGPGTLYALDPSWDTVAEYRGIAFDQPLVPTYANGRSITFRNTTFTGGYGAIPSQNALWQAINTNMVDADVEVDKLVTEMVLDTCTIRILDFQSSSVDLLRARRLNVTNSMHGTPKKAVIYDNSTIALFRPGAYNYGRSDELIVADSTIPVLSVMGVIDKGVGELGVNNCYTMVSGVIIVPNSRGTPGQFGAVTWAVPGTWCMFKGADENETMFQVLDVTQDATNTYIQTNLSGGFPTDSSMLTSGMLYIHAQPAPKCTFRNVVGCADVVDLSGAPPGAPIYSYTRRTLTKDDTAATVSSILWGDLTSLRVTVNTAYAGATNPFILNIVMAFIKPDMTRVLYNSTVINCRIAGTRTITPAGVTGAQSGDTLAPLPSAASDWSSGGVNVFWGANISAQSTPFSVTIECNPNQGLPANSSFVCSFN